MCLPASMPHGYTNDTTRDGPRVVKHYLGPDAALRREREACVLAALAGRLPVPPVLGGHGTRLTIGFMPGRHGQDLIAAGLAEPVLAACVDIRQTYQRSGFAKIQIAPRSTCAPTTCSPPSP